MMRRWSSPGPSELVSDLTGVAVSDHQGHDCLGRIVELADLDTVIPDQREIERRIEQAKSAPDERPLLVVALDGAHVPTRPRARRNAKRGKGKWRESKGVRLYLAPQEGRILQIASWHQIQDAEAMRADLQRIAARIPQQAVRIALLGDGAAWVWNTLQACFPEGRQVGARLLSLQRAPARPCREPLRRRDRGHAMGGSQPRTPIPRARIRCHRWTAAHASAQCDRLR